MRNKSMPPEPFLEELLEGPAMKLMLAADRVHPDHVRKLIAAIAAKRLATRESGCPAQPTEA